ncbi:MAG: WecB/TagA/CpsF family glycosyltransferase [Cyanobacteriota bacterium ELA615]
MSKKITILNVDLDDFTQEQLLEKLGQGGLLMTTNVDHLMILQKDPEFYRSYQLADYRVCDSKIVMYASKFLGTPIVEKLSGSDLFPSFCQYYQDNEDIKIFLLGAAEGVALQAQNNINQKIGRNIIVDVLSPSMGFETSEQECKKAIQAINQSEANVLAIGLGAPKQEKWIAMYGPQLKKIKTILLIGATIDFEAGNKQRAPKWMSEVGLEWLHRLLSEPRRLWKRYLVESLPFFWLIGKQKLGLYRCPFEQANYAHYNVPLGQILLQKKLISPEDLEEAFEIINRGDKNAKIGEILLEKGLINHKQLQQALAEQKKRMIFAKNELS